MAFFGDVCVKKIDFLESCCREIGLFGEAVVEKMGYAGDKMKTNAVLRPHPSGALPICALQRAHAQSAMRVLTLFWHFQCIFTLFSAITWGSVGPFLAIFSIFLGFFVIFVTGPLGR